MNSKIVNVFMFATGIAIGSVVTWKLIEKKYEEKIQKEIDSVKEIFSKKGPVVVHTAPEKKEENKESVTEEIRKIYNNVISDKGYTNYSEFAGTDSDEEAESESEDDEDDEKPVYAEKDTDMDEPYVISPDEFGELENYEKISLTYYADDILADEFDGLVENVDSIVGLDSLTTFGEYEDDSVFVRNDKLKCDYEILRDLRRWEDVVNPPKPKTRKASTKKPHQMEE